MVPLQRETPRIAPTGVRPVLRLMGRLLLFAPIPALMAITSWKVDPAYLFGRAHLVPAEQVANAWLSGRHVILSAWSLDERLVMRYYVNRLWPWQAPDVLVMGSSRVMKVGAALFPGRSFFNSSVSGASMEDHVGIFQLFRERGLKPRTMVLGLDPWLLNRNNRQPRWVTLEPEYRRGRERLLGRRGLSATMLSGIPTAKTFELFSPAYFQAAISIVFGFSGRPAIADGELTVLVTDQTNVDQQIRYTDGSIEDSSYVRGLSDDYVRGQAIAGANSSPPYSLGDFLNFDPDLTQLFERYVIDLRAIGVVPVFYLPPYHPAGYQRLIEQPKFRIIMDAENYFRRFAASHGIEVYGSYDPAPCGLNESDFSDMMHTKRRAMTQAFRCTVP